jgi:PhzF family phenazine biosynthesis protein
MKLKIYQVDAFADRLFSGNPAAVCPLDEWINDDLLLKIAMENNLAETAFYVKKGVDYEIRWFTPTVEVALCGHATLAAAFVLFNYEHHSADQIVFHTRERGELLVKRQNKLLTLNFPVDKYQTVNISKQLNTCFNYSPVEAYKGSYDYMLVFENEKQIASIIPDLNVVSRLDARGVIVTAKGNDVDFVTRFFAPQSGIDEDPVTGSAQTILIPYWAARFGKNELNASQLSKRKGFLKCKYLNGRVEISGDAKLYLIGEIFTE